MPNLFDAENAQSGFRLTTLELFNWGTFDGKIWRLCPDGKSSLLTGGNGSGKTTVVDAIVTLLVPPARRYYNQSSGADRKRDRSEDSYVKGAFKTLQYEGQLSPKVEYLRTRDDFSILLGVFYNADLKETLSLAQVRWYANNDLKKAYITAPQALFIREHFYPIGNDGQWKKRLKKACRAEFFGSFQQYSHRFSRVFGFKSEKALALFSQTVGIKVIGNLNEFIRTHMLEQNNVEDIFRRLRDNYDNLLFSHRAIEKAETQLERLAPIIEGGDRYDRLAGQLQSLEAAEKAAGPCFAVQKNKVLTAAVAQNRQALKGVEADMEGVAAALADLEQARDDLIAAISRNAVAEQLRAIEKEIEGAGRERQARKVRMDAYNTIAQRLDLPVNPDEAVFRQTRVHLADRKTVCDAELDRLMDQWRELASEKADLETALAAVIAERKALMGRNSNIPASRLALRKTLADQLELAEADLPFAGELVRIKTDRPNWRGAMERLLRQFGLGLLVRQDVYPRFNALVHRLDLQARVVFYKVPEKWKPALFTSPSPDHLFGRLEIKPDTALGDWIADHLQRQFNHILTEKLDDFQRLERALTGNGLVKTGERHEKDDRPESISPENYIFGWDNREKIEHLSEKAKSLESRRRAAEKGVGANQHRRRALEIKKEGLIELAGYTCFQDLDWPSEAARIADLTVQKNRLLESSDALREMERQLAQVNARREQKQARRDELTRVQFGLVEKNRRYQRTLAENQQVLAPWSSEELADFLKCLTPHLPRVETGATLETIDTAHAAVLADIDHRFKKASAGCQKVEKELIRRMGAFKSPDPALLEKYPDWTAETTNLVLDSAYLAEYRSLHTRIQNDDLPRYKQRFKQFLNEQVVLDIANFKTSLDNYAEEIRQSIREINRSLKAIDYNSVPRTYIRLIEKDEVDVRIREFKRMLREAMPDAARLIQGDEQELEHSFIQIRVMIEKLSQEVEWRRYVTDVRNWLRFAAEEKYREDGVQKQYYADSQSLSGGEKAKLAYTILASAIAYQFGIQKKRFHLKSFRFVVVDEAFSKVDPENSVYAMELFKNLNLQLMLVTPLDKINLAENYIHSVHYVENKHQRDSAVYDLTLEQYRTEKAAYRNEAAVAG